MTELLTRTADDDIETPRFTETKAIWEDTDTFYTGGDRCRLHLYDHCIQYQENDTQLEKPAMVYPVGYEPLCKICVAAWRDRNA